LFSVGGMAQGKEWSKHFLGQTHSLQVTLCLVSEEWPRVRNGPGSEIRNNLSSLFVKNRADSPLLMRADILSDLTNVSERSAQRIQFIFNSIFYAGWHQMIVMDSRDILLWWICSTVREADILSELTDVSERVVQIIQSIS
jgi:hypothetical protein